MYSAFFLLNYRSWQLSCRQSYYRETKTINALTNSISEAIDHHDELTFMISTAVKRLTDLSQINATSSEELAATSEEISSLSQELRSMVEKYRTAREQGSEPIIQGSEPHNSRDTDNDPKPS